jgi:proteasome accessory factor B
MRTKDCISRCLHIVRRLKRGQKASFPDIQRYLNEMSALTGEDYTISIRTFQRDLDAIRELFLIDIRYSRIEGLYSINDEFSDEIQSERLMESLEVFHSLKMMNSLSGIFHFEARPPLGTEHLSRMIFAIKNKRIITLTYNKNWENQFTERTLLPLLLKEFRGRWYVVAKRMDTNAIRTYSLDRVVAFSIQENQASPPTNLENYYYYSFGIYVKTDPNPQEVVLKFSPEAGRYIKEAVLHHSQKVIEDSAEAFVVKLYLSITFDFVMEILGYGELLEVISPAELRTQVSDRLRKAVEKYK